MSPVIQYSWSCERFMHRPSTFHTSDYHRTSKPKKLCPLGYVHCFVVMCKQAIVLSIICLFFPCSPSDISRLVPQSTVFAIKRMAMDWPFTDFRNNIFNERGGIMPWLKEFYSISSVKFKSWNLWVVASVFYAAPKSENIIIGAPVFFSTASAGFRVSIQKIVASNNCAIAAITGTCPRSKPRPSSYSFNCDQLPEFHTSQLFHWSSSHSKLFCIAVCVSSVTHLPNLI